MSPSTSCCQGHKEIHVQECEFLGACYAVGTKTLQGKKCYVPQKRLKKGLHKLRREEEVLDPTVTLFSVSGRNSSVAVSRNSRIGLSCVTPWIRSSLCSSNRADKVFSSSVLPGVGRGERDREMHRRS